LIKIVYLTLFSRSQTYNLLTQNFIFLHIFADGSELIRKKQKQKAVDQSDPITAGWTFPKAGELGKRGFGLDA